MHKMHYCRLFDVCRVTLTARERLKGLGSSLTRWIGPDLAMINMYFFKNILTVQRKYAIVFFPGEAFILVFQCRLSVFLLSPLVVLFFRYQLYHYQIFSQLPICFGYFSLCSTFRHRKGDYFYWRYHIRCIIFVFLFLRAKKIGLGNQLSFLPVLLYSCFKILSFFWYSITNSKVSTFICKRNCYYRPTENLTD